jgi:FlaA1/EpsC-like NDP-sugar epimerase
MFHKLLKKFINLKRLQKQLIMVFFDSVVIVSVLLSSFSLSSLSNNYYWYWPKEETFWIIFGAPVLAIPVFFSFRLYQSVVRYIGFRAFSSIFQAVTLYAFVWGSISLMSNHPYMILFLGIDSNPFASSGIYFEDISRSIIFINWMLALILIGGSRLFARWLFNDENFYPGMGKNNVIIYGAGSSGRQLSQVLQSSTEYKHVAYIDDNLAKDRAYINNIPVFSYNDIEILIEKNNISDILLALPSISRRKRNKIIKKLSQFSVHVRSLPSVSELAGGKVKIDDLLEIDIQDLLGRDPVSPNSKLLKTNISQKVVMVTGAGGSIGSELSRQILLLKPKKLILFEVSEHSLYNIEQELKGINKLNIAIEPILGSVLDSKRIKNVIECFEVKTIYHAAAYKHVPLVEHNKFQGILNNAIGTKIVAEASIIEGIETFVLISTDKAVRPTSIMGVSKRIAELTLQALAQEQNKTCLTMVRFGNVLDSSGSVIPLFKKQIRDGGPVTVTDSEIVRYFMTIPEAVELVIQAGAMGEGGDVFVLDMGEPVKIYDLAVKLIQLSGLQVLDDNNPDGDIQIVFTGLRPGEKLYEELLVGDNVVNTENDLIFRAKEKTLNWDILSPLLQELELSLSSNDLKQVTSLILKLVPEFNPALHSNS